MIANEDDWHELIRLRVIFKYRGRFPLVLTAVYVFSSEDVFVTHGHTTSHDGPVDIAMLSSFYSQSRKPL
jgi:hypothetical protein